MKKMILALTFAAACFAAFPDELPRISNEVLALLQAKYERDVSNETGRVFWHGKKIDTITDASNKVVITTFADGKRFIDKANVITPKMSVENANKKLPRTVDKKGVPKALVEAREKRAAEKALGTVEVNREIKAGGAL